MGFSLGIGTGIEIGVFGGGEGGWWGWIGGIVGVVVVVLVRGGAAVVGFGWGHGYGYLWVVS